MGIGSQPKQSRRRRLRQHHIHLDPLRRLRKRHQPHARTVRAVTIAISHRAPEPVIRLRLRLHHQAGREQAVNCAGARKYRFDCYAAAYFIMHSWVKSCSDGTRRAGSVPIFRIRAYGYVMLHGNAGGLDWDRFVLKGTSNAYLVKGAFALLEIRAWFLLSVRLAGFWGSLAVRCERPG